MATHIAKRISCPRNSRLQCVLLLLLLQTERILGQKNGSPTQTQGSKNGKNNKGSTQSPTTSTLQPFAPSFSPSKLWLSSTSSPTVTATTRVTFAPTPFPTHSPSHAPTIQLTSPPTAVATNLPSSAPSPNPSSQPSSTPSLAIPLASLSTIAPSFPPSNSVLEPTSSTEGVTNVIPSSKPTVHPTHFPTKPPHFSDATGFIVPSSSPLAGTTANASFTAVAMPSLGISFAEQDQQHEFSAGGLQQILSSWLSGYLITSAKFGPILDHVELQVVEMSQNPVTRHLQQQRGGLTQVNVLFKGTAFFIEAARQNSKIEDIPSSADLFNTLNVFFSEQSGVQALQDVLSSIVTVDEMHGVQVLVNGALVTAPAASASALSPTTQTSPTTKSKSVGLYLGLGLGVLTLTVALIMVFMLRRKRVLVPLTSSFAGARFCRFRRRGASKPLGTAAALQQARIGASPREKAVARAGSDISVQSAVSFDDSMYTPDANTTYRPPVPPSPGSYDVKRLERVIRSAKEIVKELSDDESLYLRSI